VTEVIGVAADTRAVDLQRTDVLFAYLPYWLRGPSSASIVIRAGTSPASLATTAKEAIWSVDRSVPIPRVQTMDEALARAVGDRRFELSLLMLFGAAAGLLAAMGVFGVVSHCCETPKGDGHSRRARRRAIRHPTANRRRGPLPVGLESAPARSLARDRTDDGEPPFEVRPGDPLVMASAAAACC
jgi:hypothetical protein